MKPLNQKERNSFYWQFLIIYIISVVVVIIAVSFFYEVNDKEVQVLRDQKEKFKTYEQMPAKMNEDIKKLDSLLVKLEDPNIPESQIEGEIKNLLSAIPNVDGNRQSSLDTLTQKIKDTYYKIFEDKGRIRTSNQSTGIASQASKQVEELKKQLDDCEEERKTLEIKLDLK